MVLTLSSTGGNPGVHATGSSRATNPRLQEILAAANRKFAGSQFEPALLEYRRGLAATPPSLPYYRAVFLTGLGNCEGMLLKNSEAIRSFNQALRLARKYHWPDIEMKAAVGRITIYKRMWDLPAAQQTVRESQQLFQETREPATLAQLASIALDVDFDAAMRLYRQAILEGSMRSDNHALAMLWAQLGYAWLMHGDAARAEPALTEAFRLRKSAGGRELQGFYYMLGWLRRLQGRCGEARTLLQHARSRAPEPGSVSPYFIERELARTAAACGDLHASVEHYENTLRLIEEWRAFMLPAEAFRANAEEGLHGFFAEFVGVGLRLYEQTRDPRLAARLFLASQASRRSLFRAESARQAALPPAYLAKVAEYRRALGQSVNDSTEALTARLNQLRLELANLEAEAGIPLEKNSPQFFEKGVSEFALKSVQTNLRRTEVLISFLASESGSFVWALTSDSLEVHRVPDLASLAGHVHAYRKSVETGSPQWEKDGQMVVDDLFSGLSSAALSRPDWILSLDGPLFDLPVASLPDPSGKGVVAEHHSVRMVPAVSASPVATTPRSTEFTGIADPVYNRADSRLQETARGSVGAADADNGLPRLPATSRELRRCATGWGLDHDPELVTGVGAGREALLRELGTAPAVIHLGVHVVRHPQFPDEVLLALGSAAGEPDYVTPVEIGKWRFPLGLVTLSGCSSGAGQARPGLGMFGLTRAWLRAGAASVVASFWPIRDDDGQLLPTMYSELSKQGGGTRPLQVARALQKAQIESRQRTDWQAHPSYWAAFFVVGRD